MMKTFIDYHLRKLQSEGYTGRTNISTYQRFEWLRDQRKKEGVDITIPAGNWLRR